MSGSSESVVYVLDGRLRILYFVCLGSDTVFSLVVVMQSC